MSFFCERVFVGSVNCAHSNVFFPCLEIFGWWIVFSQALIHSMDPEDMKLARRRVESAICALGGYIKDVREQREESPGTSPSSSSGEGAVPGSASVFRRQMGFGSRTNNNSSSSSSTTNIIRSSSTNSSNYYRERFHQRYFVGDHGISWEVEENPPVFVSADEGDSGPDRNRPRSVAAGATRSGSPKTPRIRCSIAGGNHRSSQPQQPQKQRPYDPDSFRILDPLVSGGSDLMLDQRLNQKMKYRCKLCGQPKQNHICPYRKSLVRTLGIMVCPAVNAYQSAEPGVLTCALSEMNNFVPYGRPDGEEDETDNRPAGTDGSSPIRSSRNYHATPGGFSDKILPRGDPKHNSPASSSLSTSPQSDAENWHTGRHRTGSRPQQQQQQRGGSLWQQRPPDLRRPPQNPIFLTLALRPEHYRAVTPRRAYRHQQQQQQQREDRRDDDTERGSYEYPHVPLTFSGRKRLTDTLFYLSQKIPSVTADVASLLRMARERDEWDLAVAEVLTQVVVCLHCAEGDHKLAGLRSYLRKIGIAS